MAISVTVLYSPAARQVDEKSLSLPEGSTVLDALQASGLLERYPGINPAQVALGVWGRKALSGQVLQDHDRIEIYRPLLVDPKVARRERFQKQGARSAGLFARKRDGAKAGY
jgi:hypothetical protein